MVKSWIGDGGENLKAYFLLIVSVQVYQTEAQGKAEASSPYR